VTNLIPIPPFEGEYLIRQIGNRRSWRPCEVIAVSYKESGGSKFIIITENDDGDLYVDDAEAVRRD
jgi:Zn-dependent protease